MISHKKTSQIIIFCPPKKVTGGPEALHQLSNKLIELGIQNVFMHYKYETKKYKYLADYFLNLQLWNDKRFKFQYISYVISEYNDEGVSSLNMDNESIFDRVKNTIKAMPYYYAPYIFLRLNIPVLKLKINKK